MFTVQTKDFFSPQVVILRNLRTPAYLVGQSGVPVRHAYRCRADVDEF